MKGDSYGDAAREFPFIGVVGGSGGDACLGAICSSGRRGSEHRYAKCRICPGFLPPVGEFARPRLLAAGIRTGPVLNKARQRAAVDIYGKPLSDTNAPLVSVGDYTAPILQPWAAEVVKEHAEKELNDGPALNPINQCRPGGVPFVFYNLGMEMLQQPNSITILYVFDHEVRRVRLNQAHPVQLTPSWFGDSVGHYEADTLVIDTVGIKTGPYTMVDQFGTPHTQALHVIERYRLIDYEAAKQALERGAKENANFLNNDSGVVTDLNATGKHLQLDFTVGDEGVFTTVGDRHLSTRCERRVVERISGSCLRRKSA
jgi:hypothetical protein